MHLPLHLHYTPGAIHGAYRSLSPHPGGLISGALILVAAAVAVLHSGTVPWGTPGGPSDRSDIQGTVEMVAGSGSRAVVIVRGTDSARTVLVVHPSGGIVTNDGRLISPGAVRPGDQVLVRHRGRLVDRSQQVAQVQGIVADVPDPGENDLVIAQGSAKSLVVDLGRGTTFGDQTGQTSTIADIEQADQVVVHGVLDDAMGEMTETDSIVRQG